MDAHQVQPSSSLATVLAADLWARNSAAAFCRHSA